MERVKHRPTLKQRILIALEPLIDASLLLLVPLLAVVGRYPWWMVTPDDPVSPFGSGTSPTASREPTQMRVYERFGRYVGDVVWLAWRNRNYGLAYWLKPAWLKEPGIRYEDLLFEVEGDEADRTFWLQQPDGTWLWERQRKFGPFILLTGYRIEPAYSGAQENWTRLAQGWQRAPRPAFHPNMDGRPVLSIRTKRTM